MARLDVAHPLEQRRVARDIAECQQFIDLTRIDLGTERRMRQKRLGL